MSIREMTQVRGTAPQPHGTSPVWDPSWEWHFGADLHMPMAGWVLQDPPSPPSCLCQGSYLEIKKQMDKLDPLAHPLLQW